MSEQTPSVGRIVIVRDPSNGGGEAGTAPAIINRVWSPTCVNVTVFPDCAPPYSKTSLTLAEPGTLKEGEWQWPTRT